VNALVARADQRIKRPWNRNAPEARELRNYDDFLLEVDNTGAEAGAVPFLLYLKSPPSAPGCLATLCLPDGTPTGAPVQISKNWHLGSYLCAYMYLPAPAGKSTFLLRISYGFYGTDPAGLALATLARRLWRQRPLGPGGHRWVGRNPMSRHGQQPY